MNQICDTAVCMPTCKVRRHAANRHQQGRHQSIRHPIRVADKNDGVQHTIANFNMYVYLPHNFKGTHMSRFIEILNTREREIRSRISRTCCARW